jgi:spore coat protein U-like protein
MTSATNGTGAGISTGISFNVTGQTTAADLVNAPAGNYADTVILTVNP